jgi:DNA-binding NarL/FixJ family response regulator
MPESCGSPKVIVVDALDLRRAGMIRLLEPWASSAGLELAALTPDKAPDKLEAGFCCKMLILAVGGASILGRDNLRSLKVLRALSPDIPIVIVSDNADSDEVAAALDLGTQGFLHTEMTPELAMQAFSFILSGGSYFPPSAMRQLQSRSEVGQDPGFVNAVGMIDPDQKQFLAMRATGVLDDNESRGSTLTARQKAVLEHLRQGQPNKLIARRLGMTEATVKVHVRQIMRKLGAANRTQAAVCAMGSDSVWNQPSTIGPISTPGSSGKPLSHNGSEGASSNN